MSQAKPGGLSKRLIAVWVVLAVLAVAIVLIERGDRATMKTGEGARDERALLPISILDIGAVEVLNQGTPHRFERDAAGVWFYHGVHAESQAQHEHKVDLEAAARIDKAMIGFGRTRMEQQFPLNVQADEFGVTRPEIFIMVYPPKTPQPIARYAVGIVAPDGVSRYVLPVGKSNVVTIPDFHVENLLNLIASFTSASAPARPAAPAR